MASGTLHQDSNLVLHLTHRVSFALLTFASGRHDIIDCERASVDTKIREHRRNELKYPLESCVEFKVLGRWRNNLDDSGEADTYYVTVGDMLENGHDKDDVKAAIKAFYEASLEAALTAVDEYEPGQLDDEQ